MDASTIAQTDVGTRSKQAITRELEDRWARIAQAMEAAEPTALSQMCEAYWIGVAAGVAVFNKAIDGVYR